jgi:hypothetical protein
MSTVAPISGLVTISPGPRWELVTTGVPQASDSVITMPKASSWDGSTVTAASE